MQRTLEFTLENGRCCRHVTCIGICLRHHHGHLNPEFVAEARENLMANPHPAVRGPACPCAFLLAFYVWPWPSRYWVRRNGVHRRDSNPSRTMLRLSDSAACVSLRRYSVSWNKSRLENMEQRLASMSTFVIPTKRPKRAMQPQDAFNSGPDRELRITPTPLPFVLGMISAAKLPERLPSI